MALAGILLIPAAVTIWTAVQKFLTPVPPDAFALGLTGLGALAVNLFCATLLAKYRTHSGSLAVIAMKVVHPGAGCEAVVARPVNRTAPEPWMNVHKNARLTPQGRLLMVRRIEQQGWSVAAAEPKESKTANAVRSV